MIGCPRNLRAAYLQPLGSKTVDAARLVAHSILGLYPVPDLSGCLESPARHLLGQLPLLIWAQKPRLAPACHLAGTALLPGAPPLSIPAHPRLYRPVVHSHSCRRLTELPSRTGPATVHGVVYEGQRHVLPGRLPSVPPVYPPDSRSIRRGRPIMRDAPQHSMLVTAWMNYKYTASYFQVSLSSNGIRRWAQLSESGLPGALEV